MTEYVIAGDTEKFKNCLIYACGTDFKNAEKVLHRMLNNPTENDKREVSKHTNIRIEEIAQEDCWWRYNCD